MAKHVAVADTELKDNQTQITELIKESSAAPLLEESESAR